jgi:phage gp29-like protein
VLYEKWLRPVDDAIKAALSDFPKDSTDPIDSALLNARLKKLLKEIPNLFDRMDTAVLEDRLADAMYAADVNGRLARTARLSQSKGELQLAPTTTQGVQS